MNGRISHGVASCAAMMSLLFGSFAGAADVTGGAFRVSLSNAPANLHSVRITGPNGYSSVSSGASLRSLNGAPLADGVYSYEVVKTQCVDVSWAEITAAKRDNAANGRAADAQPSNCRQVVVDSGSFRIVDGAVPSSTVVEE